MQVLRAIDLFKDIKNIDCSDFEKSNSIVLDFANIENIDLLVIVSIFPMFSMFILYLAKRKESVK